MLVLLLVTATVSHAYFLDKRAADEEDLGEKLAAKKKELGDSITKKWTELSDSAARLAEELKVNIHYMYGELFIRGTNLRKPLTSKILSF